jgi:hypothetical protein
LADAHDLLPLVRKKVGDFLYPYGSFPDTEFEQHEGYETEYQTPHDDDEGERYRTEILVSAEKLVPIFLDLCELLPSRIHVSLERASADLYSRWDEFVSEEVDRADFLEIFKAYRFAFTEDGNLGVGAFARQTGVEVFLGSHKEIVVFAPERGPVAEILRRHGLEPRDLDPYYRHDHQHLPLTDYRGLRGAQFDYLHVADVVRHALGMQLQEDDDEQVDEDGKPLGLMPWHAVVIASAARRARAHRRANRAFVQEFGVTAANRAEARELLERRLAQDGHTLHSIEELFRIDVTSLPQHVRPTAEALARPGIWWVGDKTDAEPHPGQ